LKFVQEYLLYFKHPFSYFFPIHMFVHALIFVR